jgi:nitrous oxide reductase accessory protein NosL
MFVAKYPDWVAGITFGDGRTAWFDGAKDFFKFLQHPERYGQPGAAAQVDRVWVTDYYAVTLVDARQAWYVQGSDVYGPMGVELVPFERREDAEEFKKDHRGTAILRFPEVGEDTIRQLQDPG